jgi:hypothetical protein
MASHGRQRLLAAQQAGLPNMRRQLATVASSDKRTGRDGKTRLRRSAFLGLRGGKPKYIAADRAQPGWKQNAACRRLWTSNPSMDLTLFAVPGLSSQA